MPYKRGYRRRRVMRRRPRGKYNPYQVTAYRKPDAFDYARTAYTGVKKLWRYVNTEIKAHDETVTANTNNTGSIHNLAIIPQGDDFDERSGISVKPLKLRIKMTFTIHASASTTVGRFVILRGKAENGTNITVNDLYPGTGVRQFKVYDKRFKTKVLLDQMFTLSNSGQKIVHKNFDIPLNGHITYDAGTAGGTIYESGGLYAILVSDQATNTPNFTFQTRLSYVDN